MENNYKPFPIGVDDFEKLITNGYYYVDKTWLIKELLDRKGEVNLFTRPRRFGKTLNLSSLRYYFEYTEDKSSRRKLFEGLKIMEAGENYTAHQGQYPVITLTLKSAKQETFKLAYECLKEAIVKDLIQRADLSVKEEIETLIAGGTIRKQVHEDITYGDIYQSEDNLWNFLFFTGYLKLVSMEMTNDIPYVTMAIPNKEVAGIYRDKVISWFQDKIRLKDLSVMYQALLTGDGGIFQEELNKLLRESISYMDSKEAFYHGFLLGILGKMQEYIVRSNQEVRE